MMDTNDNIGVLYNALKKQGFNDIGDENVFRSKMADENNRKFLYDALSKNGYSDIGDYGTFNTKLSDGSTSSLQAATVAPAHPSEQYPKSPYVEGKGANTKVFGVPYTEYQQMSPEEQSKRYSNAIEQKKNAEKDFFSNYISNQLGEIDSELNKGRESVPMPAGSAFIPSSAVGAVQRFGNEENKEKQDRYTSLHAAKNLLDGANKVVEEAKKGDTGFLSSLGRGFKDKFMDADNWNMGLTDTAYSDLLRKAIEKEEQGNELSLEESKLLDAAAVNMATQAFYSSDMSRGYKAGNTTAQSIPFMLEFAVNPISSSGNTLAKGLLKHGLKRFGSAATTKAAKVAGRLSGDAAAAAGMTATTGIGRVVSGTNERMIGDVQAKIEDDEIKYAGRENGMDLGEALPKSAISNFLENQSEMVFNAFAGGGKMAKDALSKFIPNLSRLSNSEIVQFISKIKSNPTIRNVAQRTQFHGLIGEYAEEVYNNLANIPLGEMTMEQATDLDNNIDTFLGLAPTSAAFGLLGLGGMAREKYATQNNLRRFNEGLNEQDKVLFDELQQVINAGDNETTKAFVKRTLADDSLTQENKKERVFAVQDMQKEQSIEEVQEEKNAPLAEDIEANKVDIYRNFKRAERKANNLLPGELVSQLDAVTDIGQFAFDNNLNEQQASAVADYLPEKELFSQYVAHTNKKREEAKLQAREKATEDVAKISNPEMGAVIQAKHKFSENPVYLVGGNLAFGEDGFLDQETSSETVYYVDENGERKMAQATDFDNVLSEISIPDVISQAEADAEQGFVSAEEESLQSPELPVPVRGETVLMDGSRYLIEGNNADDPSASVMAIKLNDEGEIDIENGDERPISLDDYYNLKEAELWESDSPVGQQEELQAQDNVEEVPETEEQPNEAVISAAVTEEEKEEAEETPEEKLQRVVATLPKKKDGSSIDYRALTPQQQYEYTSAAESPDVAIEDLKSDVAAKKEELEKNNARLAKATGGERAELRDIIRSKKQELEELNTFYESVAPVQTEEAKVEEGVQVPEDVRTDEDYIEWVAENSDNATEVLGAYSAAKELASHEQTMKPWQRELLGRKVSTVSFNRFGDRNHITGALAKSWLRKDGQEIDAIAQELSENGVEVTEQDIVDFIVENPTNHVSQISDKMRSLSSKFSEIATKETGIPISGPESNTGKLYLQLKEANQKLGELTEEQKHEVQNAVTADMSISDEERTVGYDESLGDYMLQYDQYRAELGEDAADEATIQVLEETNPELYHGTAEELDDIYSQIDNDNGTEGQTEDSGENQPPLSGKMVGENQELGAQEVVATEDSENEEQYSGVGPTEQIENAEEPNLVNTEQSTVNDVSAIEPSSLSQENSDNALNFDDNSVLLQDDNQKVNENDEVSESIPPGEHGTLPEVSSEQEEPVYQLRRRIEEASRDASESEGGRGRQQEVNQMIETQAKENGLWTPIQNLSNLGTPFLSGNENDTYLDRENDAVYKMNNLVSSKNLPELFKRIDLHNELFPQTKYELIGFTGFGNGSAIYPIYKQGYVDNAEFATPAEIGNYMQSLGFKQTGEAEYSNGDVIISDLRPRNVLKDVDGDIYVIDADFKKETPTPIDKTTDTGENQIDLQRDTALLQDVGSSSVGKDSEQSANKQENTKFTAPQPEPGENVLDYASRISEAKRLYDAEQKVNTNPSEAQKEAGNYKKGHIKIDGYDITIENPKASERSGVDANGQSWSVTMNNSYGYIRGTEGVDGDHIDLFLSDNPTQGSVFVVDQVNEDGSFDEHKAMYGFSSVDEARSAYLANYSPGWKGLGNITEVSKDKFKKWIDSSHRKTKPFADYSSVKVDVSENIGNITDESVSLLKSGSETEVISPQTEFTTKKQQQAADTASGNKLVTDERYAELKKRMQEKLRGQMNMGVDPEILAIGTEMAVYHIEKGSRKVAEYARDMIADLGDTIRPYLKSFYNGVRDLPEMVELSKEMDAYDIVSSFDAANFDKAVLDIAATAETVVREQEVKKQVEEVKKKRSSAKKKEKESVSLFSDDLFNQNTENNVSDRGTFQGIGKKDESLTQKTRNNGSKRGSETENAGLGESSREEPGRLHTDGVDSSHAGNNESDGSGSRGISEPSTGTAELASSESEKKNTRNNRNERGKDYAPTSHRARFDANVASIKLMRNLMDRGKTIPTAKEMQILRKYSGWGGLGTFFNNENSAENKALRDLLDEEEYNMATMSINSAYYTPSSVIDALWDAAKQLGFKGGNVLEGSAGIGDIIGLMPEGMSERSSIEAVEIDAVSGNILKLLYPDAQVHIQGFQDTNIKNGSVDLAITNVPFVTGLHVYDKIDKDLSRKFKNIHDFCIAKNIRKLREGGVGLFITSNGTLDKSKKLREWIIGQGNTDVVGAFRLNNATFGGTNVTSDIVIVRKRVGHLPSSQAIDVLNTSIERTGEYKTGETHWDKKSGAQIEDTKQVVMEYNTYFKQHPGNMAGEMAFAYEKGDTFRPGSVGLYPTKGKEQNKMIKEWIANIQPIMDERLQKVEQPIERQDTNEKEGVLLFNDNGELCVSQRGEAVALKANSNKVKGREKSECLKDYNAIKTALDEVLKYQTQNNDDKGLKPLLKKFNEAYDNFFSKYGPLNRNTSISFLKNDVDFPSIVALEDYKESKTIDGKKEVSITKTNVFNGRVIGYKAEPEPRTVKDGVIASVYKYGGINVGYISEKLAQSEEEIKKEILRERIGFVNPTTDAVEVRYEYLSGNVREKLEMAKTNNAEGEYNINIEELEKVVPMDIPAHLIEFSLGSSWVDSRLYKQFLIDEFGVTDCNVEHVEGAWILKVNDGKYNERNRQAGVYSQQFNETTYGDELVDAALNNRSVVVKRTNKNWDGSTETITDKEATQACATRIAEIKDSFKEWARGKMQQDEALAEKMMRVYNDKFNAIVPKAIDDMFLPEHFGDASESINLYPHQKKATIRGTTEPLMLAHEVGTGKTFTLISTAMEMRRIGTAKKPMIVVQNATIGQFVSESKKLYPNAKILTLSDRDRTPEGRMAFYSKIKYSDWDMIVVPQSTFEMIPDSPERQMTFIREKIDDKMHALEVMQNAGAEQGIIKDIEKELNNLEEEFASIASGETPTKKKDAKGKAKAADNAAVKAQEQLDRRTDDVQYFDEMGIDAILIDEAHAYKRLGFATAMTRGVKGIDPAGSKRSAGVYLKTRAVLEQNGWKNVVFATGTPISNTAAELWTFMKYLMPKEVMMSNDIYYFDDFVRNFGNISQSLEFATNGKFKENTRFASYINKPELIRLWASVSDTVLTKEVSYVNDKVPKMEGGKAQDLFLPQSDGLIDIMRAVRKRLDEFEHMTGKEKRANSSIPLTMYGIAKRAAIDTRLVDKNAIDEPNSKTNKAVEEILRSLKETESYKGTVALFCDNQRRWDGKIVGFDLFEDIKYKLVAQGVPEDQIVVMKSGMSIPKKEKIFADVNDGNVRVIIGNTQTLGTGVNIQERLHTLIHMDAPDRPMDYTQRNGRILRQGNLHKQWNKEVRVLRFGVEDSLDVTSYQRLKTKASFIDSVMDGKSALANNQENRTLEEEEEGLFDNPVAVLSGSQYALLKNQAEREYRKFINKKAQYEADQIYIANKLRRNEGKIKSNQALIAERKERLENIERLFPDGKVKEVVIAGKKCKTDAEIDSVLRELINKPINERAEAARKNASFKSEFAPVKMSLDRVGVDVRVRIERESVYDSKHEGFRIVMHKDVSYTAEKLGLEDVSVSGGYVRNALDDLLENVISSRDDRESIEALENANKKMLEEDKLMSERKGKSFDNEKELKAAKEKVEEYTELMRKEMAEKDAKYAERGSSSEIELSEEEDEDLRLRFIGEEGATNIDNVEEEAVRLSEEINTPIRIVRDANEITDENAKKQTRMRKAKGWYDTKTGEVVVVLPNATSEADVQATVLHEVVAHKGLRDMLGKDAFDELCGNVFDALPEDVRSDLLERYSDRLIAGDEYMASIAESNITPSLLEKIKGFVRDAFRKIGIDLSMNDKDIQYLLWKSKNRLMNSDNELDIINKVAADENMKERFHIGEYARTPEQEKADYDRAMDISNSFSEKYVGAGNTLVIRSANMMRKQLRAIGVPEGTIKEIEDMVNTSNGLACYEPNTERVIIFDTAASNRDLKSYLWHENTHKALNDIFGEEKDERILRIYKLLEDKYRPFFDEIHSVYSVETEEKQKEECIVHYFNKMFSVHGETALEKIINNASNEEKRDFFGEIFNKIVYGTAEGLIGTSGRRNVRSVEERKGEQRMESGGMHDSSPSIQGESGNQRGQSFGTDGEKEENERHGRGRVLGNVHGERIQNEGLSQQGNDQGTEDTGTTKKPGREEETDRKGRDSSSGEEEITRFRDATDNIPSDGTIEEYEEELKRQAFKTQEAYQDSMLALKKLQDVIVKNSEKELKSFEDAYTAENHLSSKNTAEMESYGNHFFRPIIEEIGNYINNGNSYEDVKRYVFAKHGLERNEVFAQRDARNAATEKYWKKKKAVQREYDEGKLTENEYKAEIQRLQIAESNFYKQQYEESRLRDYSGLTSLTGDNENYEELAKEIIDEFENSNDVSALWNVINNATKETLKKTYESGLMDKVTYEKVSKQFDYYIPLRGWNEETASDVYEYLQSEVSPVNATLKMAKGRLSLADDPFATIGNMAESNILMSNRNLMKQRFMNMVLNHPSDAISLSEAWYVKDTSTGDWVLSTPDIKENETSEEVRQKIEEHEDRMQQLAKNGEATKVKEGLNINYRVSDRQAREHMIVVKRNGKEYVMYVNGNPRAAQAINGMTNPNVNEHPVWKWVGSFNRQLASNFTTRNPAFVATNLSRDLIYSVSSTYAKEGTVYGNKFIGNIPKAMKIVMRNLKGHGGNSVEDVYFKEYLANGGETGYANLKDVEAYKKFVKSEIGKITGKKDYFKYLKACASFFSLMNRWAENVSRFNAYMTSREMGKNVFDSVSEAKEVTVNFNKKGAGYKTKGSFGLTSGTFRELFLFFNAGIQSLNNFSKIAAIHKKGFLKMVGGFTVAGYMVPILNALLMPDGDDDEDYYDNLPEWVRRNNICIYIGYGKFFTVPLPIELRAFYGLGEMAYQETIGNGRGGKQIAYDVINQITELLPINPLGSNGDIVSSFTPDFAKPVVQIIRNKDYTGKPIYKENSFNEYMPEWTKTYKGTSKWLKDLSGWANDVTGGDKYKRGSVNFNPAKVEHLFESYFGGMAKTINQASNTLVAGVESVVNGEVSEDLIWRNAPILNRIINDGNDDRTSFSKVNSRYYNLYDIYRDARREFNGYKKEISSGNFDYLEKLSDLQNSKEFEIYVAFEKYRKTMDKLRKLEKTFPESNKVERKEIEMKMMDIKKEIVKSIDGE